MRYPTEETAEKHERILEEAARLFREKGFGGVSVGELMKSAGLTHGPFYNHFPSKEALMAEVIERLIEESGKQLENYGCNASGRARYIAAYLSAEHRDRRGTGCPMAALSVEVGRDEKLKPPFTRAFKNLLDRMVRCWQRSSRHPPRSESIRMLATMVGAIVLSRAIDDEALSKEILREARNALLLKQEKCRFA